MKKIKLGVLGLVSMFVLSLGLGLDTSNHQDNSSLPKKNIILYSSEHGVQI
jgi:hypothetical protein